MTMQQTAPPAPVPPYAPSWGLYIYGTRAFFTFDSRLVAQATVATPGQEARIEAMFQRLTDRQRTGSV